MLWIAFKFVSLSYDKQQAAVLRGAVRGCELLSNLYLCPMTNNQLDFRNPSILVVNCFQICIFVLWQTTVGTRLKETDRLWIAFKFVSLSYDKQPGPISFTIDYVVNCFQICIFVLWQTTYKSIRCAACSCELLSNLYLCPMTNNFWVVLYSHAIVVNCFQICIFVLWQTTRIAEERHKVWLWIAFKFVSLSYDKQLTKSRVVWSPSCELLSNLYLCPMTNNRAHL